MSIFDIFDQINKNKAPKPTGPVEYIIEVWETQGHNMKTPATTQAL